MSREIRLSKDAYCADCGWRLKKGETVQYYGRDRVYGIGCHKVDWKAIRAKKAEVQHAAVALIYAWDSGEPVGSWPLEDLRDALVESGADLHAALPF